MKIIVLGGGGFIGSHVADALSKKVMDGLFVKSGVGLNIC